MRLEIIHQFLLVRCQFDVGELIKAAQRVLVFLVGDISLGAVNEALRLWPTVPMFTRAPFEETTLGGVYHVTPEDRIGVMTTMLHRDKAVWGDDAARYVPRGEQHMIVYERK